MSEPHQENDHVVEEHEDSANLVMAQSFVHNVHQEQDEDETEVIVASEIVSGNQHAQPSQPPLQKHISNVMTESTYEIQKKAENLLKQSSIPIPEASVVQETELEKSGKADNEFYPEDHQEITDAPQPFFHPQTIDFYDSCGMDSNKKNNLWLINDQVFVYASAISYQFFNFKEGTGDIHFSRDGGGIGSLAVHPSKQWYSVAEKGNWPNVYIYSTTHKLYRILRRGTERSYSNSCFTKDGTKLATVGSSPDYQICIWDWKQENILLKAKAFSQEVYKVVFSEYNPNLLGTSGMGHIKFWKVAETFTGLKLKGEIGKFGQVELSDVYAFYTFPDGKVLSGTEYGRLILWEGNVIKLVVGESEETPCHNGSIEQLFLYGDCVVSAGKDGYLKSWRLTELDQAEGDDQLNYYTQPVKSLQLIENLEPALIIQVVQGTNFWLIGDQAGKVWTVDWENGKTEIVYRSNSGPLNDLAVSNQMNAAVTVGDDGCVRLWNYVDQGSNLFYERRFHGKATTCTWMPFSIKNNGRMIAVGYANGIVRFLLLNQDGFYLVKALKVHQHGIQAIRVCSNGSLIVVLSVTGDIFILKYSDQNIYTIEPFCLWETKLPINDIALHQSGNRVLLGCKDGKLYECSIPENVDNSENYLIEMKSTSYLVRMMESQKPKKEDMDLQFLMKMKEDKMPDIEWEPASIMNISYFGDRVLCTVEGKYIGCLYLIDFSKDRPIDMYPILKTFTQYLNYNDDVIFIGYKNGIWEIRHKSDFNKALSKQAHDMDYGRVRKVALNYDKTTVMSVADDGTFNLYKIDYQAMLQQLNGTELNDFVHPELQNGINSTSFTDPIDVLEEQDILDDKIYSIQQAKLLAEEDHRRNEADKKKETVKTRIQKLRDQFQQLRTLNQQQDEASKLTEEELCVDPEYREMLLKRVEEDMEETRKELEWDQEYARLKASKLKGYMMDELEMDKFMVKGIKAGSWVQSFKVLKLSNFCREQLKETYRLIEEERRNQESIQPVEQVTFQQSQVKIQHVEVAVEIDSKLSQAKAERERQRQEEEKIRREQELLEKTKPTKESFEPDHQKDLQEAIEGLGDYKLKSDKDFVVPENQRMNVSKKRKHMFMLEEFIYNTKVKFNQQLLNLKQRKVSIIDKIKRYNQQIAKINQQLNKTEVLFAPDIDRELEDPHSFLEISDEQISEYTKQAQKKEEVKRIAPAGIAKPAEQAQIKTRKGIRQQQSQLEDEMKIIQEMVLQAEKQRMVEEMNDEIAQFDRDVVKCENEKNVLESDMLIAQMKLVTFYQELIILEEMEDYDNKLIGELLDFKKEKGALDEQNENIVATLQGLARKEQSNEKELNEKMKEWKELVHPDDEVKRERIHQYYFKKYKRDQAKKLKKQQESDSEEKDEDDEEDEDDFDEEEEDEEDKPDISQVENELKIKEVIEKICELEDNQDKNRKEKQDNDRLKIQIGNKIQLVLKDLKRADDDLRQYQRKKLQRVNLLDVAYVLKLSQIQNLNAQNLLPSDLNTSILFTEQEYFKLCKRIVELHHEQKKIERIQKQKEKSKKILEKEIKVKDLKIEDLNKKYEEKHMLKFGDIIDLKILDALEPTKAVLDARQQFQVEEKDCLRKVARQKEELSKVKQNLLEVKRENTKIFNYITKLGQNQMQLSKKLTSGSKQLFKGETKQKKSDLEDDKQCLEDLIKFLTKEIEDLKTEIGQYKRKGGHIFTNVLATKQNFQQG